MADLPPPSPLPNSLPRALPRAVAPTRTPGGVRLWQWLLLLIGALLVFGVFNLSVLGKERLLERGTVVRLALAPRDPRALLTGDYMALNYALANEVRNEVARAVRPDLRSARRRSADADASANGGGDRELEAAFQAPGDGFLIVSLDERRVARMVRVQADAKPVAGGEYALRYRYRNERVQLGSDAFFFEEGSASRYEVARFGEYRVDASGAMLLVKLLDEQLRPL